MRRYFDSYRASILFFILSISSICWILLVFEHSINHSNHGIVHNMKKTDLLPNLSEIKNWTIMVIAMMLPKLTMPLEHIYLRSLKRRRLLSSLLFLVGYIAVWLIVGYLILLANNAFNLSVQSSSFLIVLIGIITLIWQCSPLKQYFLNRSHSHRSIKVFGVSAFTDTFRFGIEHGLFCVGAGWALMWFPMLLPKGHIIAMLVVTYIMISEHMEQTRLPKWHFNFNSKLWRIIKAQTKIRLAA